MAEAVVKGYISGNANELYREAITASLEYNEIPAADYANFLTTKVLSGTTALALEQIATQNWVGLYTQGVESWNEWRRTGFPVLQPATDAAIDEIPSRYNYPTPEGSINKANYEAAVAAQGPDNLTTTIWWMN
jgi:hypothetical protein